MKQQTKTVQMFAAVDPARGVLYEASFCGDAATVASLIDSLPGLSSRVEIISVTVTFTYTPKETEANL